MWGRFVVLFLTAGLTGLTVSAQSGASEPVPLAEASDARPSPFPLSLPIDCRPGVDCWVLNHFDLDPGPGRRDYRCGSMTADGHYGTGFGLRNLASLDADVMVRAAAPGRVTDLRDGIEDTGVDRAHPEKVRGLECGNGVRIEHDSGWATQYCHLRRGSVGVQQGQPVVAGQVLGFVGLSGNTEYPHVFFRVEKGGQPVDPFRGVDGGPPCGRGTAPLWDAEARRVLVDHAPFLLDAGFATGPVERSDAEAGTAGRKTAGTNAPALVVWSRAAGIEPGDLLATAILGPDGSVLHADRWVAGHTRIMQFRFVGKRRVADAWAPGDYIGLVLLQRGDQPFRTLSVSIRLEDGRK